MLQTGIVSASYGVKAQIPISAITHILAQPFILFNLQHHLHDCHCLVDASGVGGVWEMELEMQNVV
jgi:hypothetical protein